MIVYEPSEKRVKNFKDVKETIHDLKFFPAIDTINREKYEQYIQQGLDDQSHTQQFIDDTRHVTGKIGCNMSHIYVLIDFLNSEDDWLLVLEDDIFVENYNEKQLNELVDFAKQKDSHYIQLYTNKWHFLGQQLEAEKVGENIYKMIHQWHTCAYLISRNGAQRTLAHLPFSDPIDHIYGILISELNSLCYINDIFIYKGIMNYNHTESELGSIILDR